MKKTMLALLANTAPCLPILSFPSVRLTGKTVLQLVTSAEAQAEGMSAICSRCNTSAALNMMDLSVEAEAFGAKIVFSENEIPTVQKGVIEDISQAQALLVPQIGTARTATYIEGVRLAKQRLNGKPVLCGIIGPYSLAGRLFDMTELMYACYDEPEATSVLLDKCTQFLSHYVCALAAAGADGVIMAEPAAGLLSPTLCAQFSTPYVKRVLDGVNRDGFLTIYHNCGNVLPLADTIYSIGADAYHFGNAVRLADMARKCPKDAVIMGNLNPVSLKRGTPAQVATDTAALLDDMQGVENYIPSTGCDVPWDANWQCIDAFFAAVSRSAAQRTK